jgi:hypothetical protein
MKGTVMGYNRSGKKRTQRLKRHRREGQRLAAKANATAAQAKPATTKS